jgi:hypothetical protein
MWPAHERLCYLWHADEAESTSLCASAAQTSGEAQKRPHNRDSVQRSRLRSSSSGYGRENGERARAYACADAAPRSGEHASRGRAVCGAREFTCSVHAAAAGRWIGGRGGDWNAVGVPAPSDVVPDGEAGRGRASGDVRARTSSVGLVRAARAMGGIGESPGSDEKARRQSAWEPVRGRRDGAKPRSVLRSAAGRAASRGQRCPRPWRRAAS